MTNETRARVAPAAESAQLTEQVSVLTTEDMRAFLLGSKIRDSGRSEGAAARALLEDAIASYAGAWPAEYELRMEVGRAELARRRQERA